MTNLDEWHEVLATERATPTQVGAVHGEFSRLGYRGADRARRLTVTAALLGLDGLGSSRDLSMGEAGRAVRMLRGFGSRRELDAAIAGGREHRATARPDVLPVVVRLMIILEAQRDWTVPWP